MKKYYIQMFLWSEIIIISGENLNLSKLFVRIKVGIKKEKV